MFWNMNEPAIEDANNQEFNGLKEQYLHCLISTKTLQNLQLIIVQIPHTSFK